MAVQEVDAQAQAEAGAMGLEELLSLPATVNVTTAGRALGIGRDKAYELVRSGRFPVRTLPLGRTVRVPTAELWRLLGIEPRRGVEAEV
ncbi:helix-turn-helix domain-containing protein [Streptomyces sp. V3I7]|uniref:helix-turn-helix domain-containing protein n=1 Tax=Streptomyces sp. V3I7 TaxID=3042278 RepID=UPI00277D9B04|nr:helix-turn-helix domain-containing protein [Streptomyces sp. V3I7]MDQ0990774.1 putative DNA-binding transcriptional regulator AlpA [Streptomyces sp. V3I7]